MKASEIRALIERILFHRRKPMTTAEISDALYLRNGIRLSNQSIGVNLGYLHVAGTVNRRQAPVWGKPYWLHGKWNFQTQNWWWHNQVVSKGEGFAFVMKIRREVEMKARDNQRIKGRPVSNRLPPRTDDMRQMLVDLGRVL